MFKNAAPYDGAAFNLVNLREKGVFFAIHGKFFFDLFQLRDCDFSRTITGRKITT